LKEFEEYVDKENKEYEKQKRDADKQTKIKPPSFGGFQMTKYELPKH
jgi:hypothetical protein